MDTTGELRPVDTAKVINRVLGGMRRRGMPASVDQDDMRQIASIAVFQSGVAGPKKHVATIARNAMCDYLRVKIREGKYFTGMQVVDGVVVGSDGNVVGHRHSRTSDPFFVLDIDGLEVRQDEWERERAERWAR